MVSHFTCFSIDLVAYKAPVTRCLHCRTIPHGPLALDVKGYAICGRGSSLKVLAMQPHTPLTYFPIVSINSYWSPREKVASVVAPDCCSGSHTSSSGSSSDSIAYTALLTVM